MVVLVNEIARRYIAVANSQLVDVLQAEQHLPQRILCPTLSGELHLKEPSPQAWPGKHGHDHISAKLILKEIQVVDDIVVIELEQPLLVLFFLWAQDARFEAAISLFFHNLESYIVDDWS